jgi:hypothetical protein
MFLDTLEDRITLGLNGVSVFFSTAEDIKYNSNDSYTIL